MRAFPPRLPEQPLFYPVLSHDYAREIAADWNTRTGKLAGYVTRFELNDRYAKQFAVHEVGGHARKELWIPAEQLDEMNRHILGAIEVIEGYFGDNFVGVVPERGALAGKGAREQLEHLVDLARHKSSPEAYEEAVIDATEAVFAHSLFWEGLRNEGDDALVELRTDALSETRQAWRRLVPGVELG
jgi:hypothetical protein